MSEQSESTRLVVSENNRLPLYHQLFLLLRSKIHDGEYAPSSYLPGEHELASKYQVSRITAVRALQELAAKGLVVREQGRGTRVLAGINTTVARGPTETMRATPSDSIGGGQEPLLGSAGYIRRSDLEVGKVLRFELVPAARDVAAVLDIETGDDVLLIERLRHFKDHPFSHLLSYLPAEYFKKWGGQDLSRSAIALLLEADGMPINRVYERVTATLADHRSSAMFNIPIGSALLKISKTAYEAQGRPVEHTISLCPPDQYQYEVTISSARPSR